MFRRLGLLDWLEMHVCLIFLEYIFPIYNNGGGLWQLLDGFGVSKVVMSNNPNFKEGDYVSSWTKWEEYSIIPGGKQLTVVDPSLCPLSYHLGCLGMLITPHFNLSLQIKITHLIMDNFLHISWLWLEQFSHWPRFIFIAI